MVNGQLEALDTRSIYALREADQVKAVAKITILVFYRTHALEGVFRSFLQACYINTPLVEHQELLLIYHEGKLLLIILVGTNEDSLVNLQELAQVRLVQLVNGDSLRLNSIVLGLDSKLHIGLCNSQFQQTVISLQCSVDTTIALVFAQVASDYITLLEAQAAAIKQQGTSIILDVCIGTVYIGYQSLLGCELCLALCIYLPERSLIALSPSGLLTCPSIAAHLWELLQNILDIHITLINLQGVALAAGLISAVAGIFGCQDKVAMTMAGNINLAIANTGLFLAHYPVVAHLQRPSNGSTFYHSIASLYCGCG